MLEGIPDTSYSDIAPIRPRLMTPGGALALAGAAETNLNVGDPARFGYLSLLEAVCTVAGTTAGTWTLRESNSGGPTFGAILIILQQPVAAAPVGTRYCWAFPVPWKTQFSTAPGNVFTIQASAATLGTWVFTCNGFHSSI